MKGKLTTAKGFWNREGLLGCRECGTSEKPHEAHGLCKTCFAKARYHRDKEHIKKVRKAHRLRMADEKARAKYEAERAWTERNLDHVRKYKREWYRANAKTKWPLGAVVEVLYAGFWCRGEIVEKTNHLRVTVRLLGGTELSIPTRFPKDIRRIDKEQAA